MRRANKKNLLITSLFTLLTTGLPGLFFNSAYATSIYDDVVNPTTTLEMGVNEGNLTDITGDYMSKFSEYCTPQVYDSITDAISDYPNQRWALTRNLSPPDGPSQFFVHFIYGPSTLDYEFESFSGGAFLGPATANAAKSVSIIKYGDDSYDCIDNSYATSLAAVLYDVSGNLHTVRPFYTNFNINYPINYQGELISDGSDIDNDDDDLSTAQEAQQGTSDNNIDTDGDGIDDLKESVWYDDRDEVFCKIDPPASNVCAYPDPTVQDVYVEVDWMNDTSSSTLFKPSSTQLGLAASMFANEDINLHFDTGEFGGGNELSDYAAALRQDSVATVPDFADYKNGGDGITANFANNRLGVWRYMVYGNFFSNATGTSGSSGWAEVLGDDLFVSGGIIENVSGVADTDRAVANTIAHELGHGLCLSDERVYFEQHEQCVFEGIDNDSGLPPINNPDAHYNLENYESVMNYRYQLTNQDDIGSVNYSHGPDGSSDHDDWSAVKTHIGGFNGSHTPYVEFGARSTRPMLLDKPLSADGLVVTESAL